MSANGRVANLDKKTETHCWSWFIESCAHRDCQRRVVTMLRQHSIRIVLVLCSLMAVLVANEVAVPALSFGSSIAIPPCSRLQVAAETSEGAAGTGAVIVLLANPGTVCEVMGFPTVVFFNNKGIAVDAHNDHVSSMLFASPKAKLVVLQKNVVASFAISWDNNPVVLKSGVSSACPSAAWMAVSLRGGVRGSIGYPAIKDAPCGGTLTVTAIQEGVTPEHS